MLLTRPQCKVTDVKFSRVHSAALTGPMFTNANVGVHLGRVVILDEQGPEFWEAPKVVAAEMEIWGHPLGSARFSLRGM